MQSFTCCIAICTVIGIVENDDGIIEAAEPDPDVDAFILPWSAATLHAILTAASAALPPCMGGDFRCRQTPPRARRKPVMLAHS